MSHLRSAVIRLAHVREDLQPHLLPLLKGGMRIKNIGYLTGEGMAFAKKVLAKYPAATIHGNPLSEVVRNRGRFNIDIFHNGNYVSVDFGMPARYGPDDAYIISDLKRRNRVPDSVQTVDDLNAVQDEKEKVIRHEALVETPAWFKATGANNVKVEEVDTQLSGPMIFVYAYFPKEWVR